MFSTTAVTKHRHRGDPQPDAGPVARPSGDHPDDRGRSCKPTATSANYVRRGIRQHAGGSYALNDHMSTQYIFTTYKLSRRYPPDREVLTDISLSFLPGAKIGVLGYNGAGKSTPAADHGRASTPNSAARRQLAPGATVGMLEQEPQLDETKDVRGTSRRAWPRSEALLDRFNELSMNYSDETADEFARVQEQIDAVDGWNLDTTLEIAMDALRCPPPDADVTTLSGGERRRVALVPAAAAPARPAAARRADQPPRRRVGRVARAPPPGLPRHRRRDHPRSLLPRQRRRAGSSSSTAAAASPTRATTPAGSSRSAPAWNTRRSRRARASGRSTRSSSGCA